MGHRPPYNHRQNTLHTPFEQEPEGNEEDAGNTAQAHRAEREIQERSPKTPEGKAPGKIPPGKGRIEVVSKPGGARVYLDGIYYGVTPISLDVIPGVHLLKVHKDGYETSREKIGILDGKSTPWSGVLPKKD